MKTIVVTGSSRGIGAAIAMKLHEEGHKVILHGKTQSKQLVELANKLNTTYITCDISNKQRVEESINKIILDYKQIDGLVNCAGIFQSKEFLDTNTEDWIKIFEINVLGSVYSSQTLIPHFINNKNGVIINIASIRAHTAGSHPMAMPYAVSKASLVNLSANLAKAYAPYIRVNSVSPGATYTDKSNQWTKEVETLHKSVPLKRIASSQEIAELVYFLLSDKASFITGQDFVIDGGYLLGRY